MQQVGTVRSNGASAFCYGSGQVVTAGNEAVVARFAAPDAAKVIGVSVGFGIADVTAWGAGAAFSIWVGGREQVRFSDQISDMLRPEFLPIEIKGGETVSVKFHNGTAADQTVAAFVRLESI